MGFPTCDRGGVRKGVADLGRPWLEDMAPGPGKFKIEVSGYILDLMIYVASCFFMIKKSYILLFLTFLVFFFKKRHDTMSKWEQNDPK